MISKFAHLIDLGSGVTALWNSLRLRAIFLTEPMTSLVRKMMESTTQLEDFAPAGQVTDQGLQELMTALEAEHFLSPQEDERKIAELRGLLEQEPIGLMYLIMTDTCNLACNYCYLSGLLQTPHVAMNMSRETIRKAVDLYKAVLDGSGMKPIVILYGGEPLVNKEGVVFAIEYASQQLPGTELIIVTNGTLVDEEMAIFLAKYSVSVGLSVDGPPAVHDRNRVTRQGKGTFEAVALAHQRLKKAGADVGLSCTITMDNVRELDGHLRWFLHNFGASKVDYNILMGGECAVTEYPRLMAEALIKCYELARGEGLTIGRMTRKVDPFAEGRFLLNDCGGCGKQLVITPDERIGVCQAFLNSGEFFYPLQEVTEPRTHPLWNAWKQRSPLNIPRCLACEAFGVCGGGCFYGPYMQHGTIMEVDPVHCVHAKETLRFLLTDMWKDVEGV